jgi:hypothetical protein
LRQRNQIYKRYLQAFKKGVYNYIKEERDPITQQRTSRRYFSGGEDFEQLSKAFTITGDFAMGPEISRRRALKIFTALLLPGINSSRWPIVAFPGKRERGVYDFQDISICLEKMDKFYESGGRNTVIFGPFGYYLQGYVQDSGRPMDVYNAMVRAISQMPREKAEFFVQYVSVYIFSSRPDLLAQLYQSFHLQPPISAVPRQFIPLSSPPSLHIDKAMASKGGIDLNSRQMDLELQNSGQEIKFHVDHSILEQFKDVPGFVPVIINLRSIPDLGQFLGVSNPIR